MKAITTWFFTGGGSGGDVRVEGEYRGLTSFSSKSRTGPSSYKRTIMSVSYHMKLFYKYVTTISLSQQSICYITYFMHLYNIYILSGVRLK